MPEPPVGGQQKMVEKRKKKAASKNKPQGSWVSNLFNNAKEVFDSGKVAGTLAESIEKQAAAQKAQAVSKGLGGTSSANPFDLLQQQLFDAANSINIQPTPYETLKKLAESQVGAQFDPQISALQSEINTHSRRGERSANTAKDMYGSLAKDYLSQLPAMTEQFAAEDRSTDQRYDQAQAQMQDQYSKQAAEQEAVLKRLGIQAAAPEASQQSQDDQAYFQNQMESDQQAAISALNEQQNAQKDYQQNLGSNAKMAGVNSYNDIMGELQDYLGQAGSQLTGLRTQKSSAIAALLAQMQAQDQQNQQSQQQQQFDNMMKMFNFQLDATKASGVGKQGGSGFGSGDGLAGITSGRQGASNYLASQYPDQPILASHLMQQLNDVLANKDVVSGKFMLDKGNPALGQAPKYSDVGQQYMEDLLRRQFEKQGSRYGTGDINATMDALMAYLGKLR